MAMNKHFSEKTHRCVL